MHRLVALCVLCFISACVAGPVPVAQDASEPELYNTTSDDSGHSMGMYFHVSPHSTILFKSWHTMTYPELYASSFAVFLMAIAYEALKAFRQYLIKKYQTPPRPHTPRNGVSPSVSLTLNGHNNHVTGSTQSFSLHETKHHHTKQLHPLLQWQHIVQALLHLVQVFLGMCLMLIYMTFNVALCVSITVGEAIGYYLFAWIPMPTSPAASASMDEGCH